MQPSKGITIHPRGEFAEKICELSPKGLLGNLKDLLVRGKSLLIESPAQFSQRLSSLKTESKTSRDVCINAGIGQASRGGGLSIFVEIYREPQLDVDEADIEDLANILLM